MFMSIVFLQTKKLICLFFIEFYLIRHAFFVMNVNKLFLNTSKIQTAWFLNWILVLVSGRNLFTIVSQYLNGDLTIICW